MALPNRVMSSRSTYIVVATFLLYVLITVLTTRFSSAVFPAPADSTSVLREVRRGNRIALLADIEDSSLPLGAMTVVATHLEDKTKPENRHKQLEEILAYIKDTPHPVILAGDMNTSGSDLTPTSFQPGTNGQDHGQAQARLVFCQAG